MVALKHFLRVKSRSKAMLFEKLLAFEKVEDRVAEAPLVIVFDVDNGVFFQ